MTEEFNIALPSDQELKQMTKDVLKQALGHSLNIKTIRRENNPSSTKFPTEVLFIETEDNQKISLFLKHMDCENTEHSERDGSNQEIRVYNELFSGKVLPVPGFYGSRWNAKMNQCHLFLEQVNGKMLKHCEVKYWHLAARALARLHAHFASGTVTLSQCDFLETFDCDYYKAWAEKALSVAAGHSTELADQLRGAMVHFDEVAELLAKQPLTLVHNDLSSKNVIVDTSATPERIVLIDWEDPGKGFGLIDLVHLKYNRLSPEDDERVSSEYFDELSRQGMAHIGSENPPILLDAGELFFTFYRIATSHLWGESSAHLIKRVDKACSVYNSLKKKL